MVKFGHLKMFSVARSIEKHVSVHSFFTYNLGFALKFSAIFALNVFAKSHRTGARATVNRKSIAHALTSGIFYEGGANATNGARDHRMLMHHNKCHNSIGKGVHN